MKDEKEFTSKRLQFINVDFIIFPKIECAFAILFAEFVFVDFSVLWQFTVRL